MFKIAECLGKPSFISGLRPGNVSSKLNISEYVFRSKFHKTSNTNNTSNMNNTNNINNTDNTNNDIIRIILVIRIAANMLGNVSVRSGACWFVLVHFGCFEFSTFTRRLL